MKTYLPDIYTAPPFMSVLTNLFFQCQLKDDWKEWEKKCENGATYRGWKDDMSVLRFLCWRLPCCDSVAQCERLLLFWLFILLQEREARVRRTFWLLTFEAEAWLLSRGLMRQPKAMQVRTRPATIRIAYSHPSAVISLKRSSHIYVCSRAAVTQKFDSKSQRCRCIGLSTNKVSLLLNRCPLPLPCVRIDLWQFLRKFFFARQRRKVTSHFCLTAPSPSLHRQS